MTEQMKGMSEDGCTILFWSEQHSQTHSMIEHHASEQSEGDEQGFFYWTRERDETGGILGALREINMPSTLKRNTNPRRNRRKSDSRTSATLQNNP